MLKGILLYRRVGTNTYETAGQCDDGGQRLGMTSRGQGRLEDSCDRSLKPAKGWWRKNIQHLPFTASNRPFRCMRESVGLVHDATWLVSFRCMRESVGLVHDATWLVSFRCTTNCKGCDACKPHGKLPHRAPRTYNPAETKLEQEWYARGRRWHWTHKPVFVEAVSVLTTKVQRARGST